MKKYLIILGISGLLAFALACNGKSPAAPNGDGTIGNLDAFKCTEYSVELLPLAGLCITASTRAMRR